MADLDAMVNLKISTEQTAADTCNSSHAAVLQQLADSEPLSDLNDEVVVTSISQYELTQPKEVRHNSHQKGRPII